MSRGAGRLITMAAGCPMTQVGRGGLGRWRRTPLTIRSGRRHMFPFSDSEAALVLESALDSDLVSVMWAGCPAVRVTGITHGTDVTAARYRAVGFNNANNFHNGWAPLHGGGRGFSNVNAAFRDGHVRSGMSSMDSRSFGHGTVPAHQTAMSAGEFRDASMVSGKMPVNPGRGSYSASSREASPSTIRSTASNSQHFYSSSRNSGGTAQSSRGYGSASNSRNNGYSGGNSGYSNSTRSAQPNINGANRGGASNSTSRPGWRTFSPPSSSGANRTAPNAQSNNRGAMANPGNRGYGAPNSASRPYQQPNAQSNMRGPMANPGNRGGYGAPNYGARPYQQPNSGARGGYPGYGGSRPPLNMRQPIVTPRNGGNSGGSRGGSGGGYRGGGGGGSHGGGGGGSHKH